MELSNYIEDKIDDFNKNYYLHSKITSCLQDKGAKNLKRKYDEVSSNSNWSKINKNKDVDNITSAIEFKIKMYSKMVDEDKALYPVDYVDVYISMYSLLYALQKVSKNLHNENYDFNYTF